MRQVTEQVVGAFLRREYAKVGNSETDGTTLYLHGNAIAKWSGDKNSDPVLWVTTAGGDTATTRERLNGLPGVSVYRRNRQLFFNGLQWDGSWICVADRPQP